MKWLFFIILLISYFEIKTMWNKGLKKEIVVFVFLGLITLSYGIYYLMNANTASLCRSFFNLIGFKY
jgi:hypothetical protein